MQTSFNLHKGAKVNDDEFDNDYLSVEEIDEMKKDKLNTYAQQMVDGTISEEDLQKFARFIRQFSEPIFTVQSKEELDKLIMTVCVKMPGYLEDLNWVDTSNVTDMGNLFHGIDINIDISKWDTSNVTSMFAMFHSNALFNCDISGWDVSKVEDMSWMFFNALTFNQPIGSWNVSRVSDMQMMFSNATMFDLPIGSWDVSSVQNMTCMFHCAAAFSQDLNGWDVSHVINMNWMFEDAKRFDPSSLHWDYNTNVSRYSMFNRAGKTDIITEAVSNFNLSKDGQLRPDTFGDDDVTADIRNYVLDKLLLPIFEKVRERIELTPSEMQYWNLHIAHNPHFYKVASLEELQSIVMQFMAVFGEELNLNWLDISRVNSLESLFKNTDFNGDISNWDVSNVKCMNRMFADSKFNGDISNWDVSSVHTMISMFYNSEFDGDISSWNVSGVGDMSAMFACSKFTGDISKWDVSNVTDMKNMFYCSRFDGDISNWNVSNVKNMSNMFLDSIFNQDISKWQLNKFVILYKAFDGVFSFNQPNTDFTLFEGMTNFNLRQGAKVNDDEFDDDVSTVEIEETHKKIKFKKLIEKIISTGQIEESDKNFIEENVKDLYNSVTPASTEELEMMVDKYCTVMGDKCDLNWLDTRLITNMKSLFYNKNFNGDLSNWDVSNVTDMADMFYGSKFNGDISRWDVSSVENISRMFKFSQFNGDISKWDVSNVRLMRQVFGFSVFNGDISKWDVSNVTDMDNMFAYTEFNRNLSNWQINSECAGLDFMFDYCPIEEKNKPKCLLCLSEAISNFNLRRDSKLNDDEFDNDEVSAEEVQRTEAKYRLRKIAPKIADKTISKEEIIYFGKHYSNEYGTIYTVKTKADLKNLIDFCTENIGNECNLNWIDVSNIKDMFELFKGSNFNGDISNWDVSQVENMDYMFCLSDFNGDISTWDVSSVKLMESIFYNSKFNRDISNWDVSNVTNMCAMFAYSLFNLNISNWKIERCNNIKSMFYHCPIKEEYKPKRLLKLTESAFTLRRDNKLNDDEFDNDEVSAELITLTLTKYKLRKIIDNILEGDDDEIKFFKEHIKEFNEPLYTVRSKEELKNLISRLSEPFILDFTGNFNWIDVSQITDMSYLFSRTSFNGNISKWDVSHVKNMERMFLQTPFNGDISNWDVSNVENMKGMFAISDFNGDISDWDVSSVVNMQRMFYKSSFNGDISKWNLNNVNTEDMFYESAYAKNHRQKSSITESESAFKLRRDSKLNDDEFDNDEVSADQIADTLTKYRLRKIVDKILDETADENEIDFLKEHYLLFDNEPFYTAKSKLTLQLIINKLSKYCGDDMPLNWIDVSQIVDMSLLFAWSNFNGDISNWDVSNVTNMEDMFCTNVNFNGDISRWNVSKVENMRQMFFNTHFNRDISEWDVSNVKNMACMFWASLFNGDISKWDVSNVTHFRYMFYDSIFNQDISDWKIKEGALTLCMFAHNDNIKEEYKPRALLKNLSESVSNFNLRRDSKVNNDEFDDNEEVSADQLLETLTKYRLMKLVLKIQNDARLDTDETIFFIENSFKFDDKPFYVATSKEELRNLAINCTHVLGPDCDLNWIDVSHMTDMSQIFLNLQFSGDISKWDVSNATDMSLMFAGCKTFNGDISNWDVSNVTDMENMFAVSNFDRDISRWDVSHVTNMCNMFYYNTAFNQDLNDWDISSVENMNWMFSGSIFDRPLDKWDVRNVKHIEGIFYMSGFNQDISNWVISEHVKDLAYAFSTLQPLNRPNGF